MPENLLLWCRWLAANGGQENAPPLSCHDLWAHFFQTPGLIVLTHSHSERWIRGPGVLTSSRSTPSSGSGGSPPHCSPLHVRILVVSWQQALLDKGCENKSQGTKEEKLVKRQAPAPRQDREAQEAGGTMNVEKTGKGGLPTNLEQPSLKLALEGRLLWHLSGPHMLSSAPGGGPARSWPPGLGTQRPQPPTPTPGMSPSQCHQGPTQ